jgi:hypothetical protein
MSLPPDYWPSLADDYVTAYQRAFPTAGGGAESLPSRNALLLAMSAAEHETNNGRAWPGTNNFGAVQLRPLTLQERAAYDAGTLKPGDYDAARDGVLHVDTHPGPSGPVPYPIWFAAFPDDRVAGIAHFLKTLWRLSSDNPDAANATPFSLADAMYQHGYYEGAHHGARPVGQRSYPLNAAEQANVTDYANAVAGCMAAIGHALASWDFGLDQNVETADPTETPTAPDRPGVPLPFHVADTEPPPPKDAA